MNQEQQINRILEVVLDLKDRMGSLEIRFDKLEKRFDNLEIRFDGLEKRFDVLEAKVDGLEIRFDGLELKVDKLEKRFDGLEVKVDAIDRKLFAMDIKIDRRIDLLDSKIEQQLAKVKNDILTHIDGFAVSNERFEFELVAMRGRYDRLQSNVYQLAEHAQVALT